MRHGGADLPLTIVAESLSPGDEAQRMVEVKRYNILDTVPDEAFDRITALAARRLDVPIAIISIVDCDRIWFKSHPGVPFSQTGRDPGLCASTILSPKPHIVVDARRDPRSLANSLVVGECGVRFYAGYPLRTQGGHNIGTLCVMDRAPRMVDQALIDDLSDLASVVMDRLQLRLSATVSLEHGKIMARESDHRVMNSLQLISGLLRMQSALPGSTAATQLRAAADRIIAVATVHRHFCSRDDADLSCLAYLRRLCTDLSGVLGKSIQVHGDEGRVPPIWMQGIGLLVNELVTNAAKHGTGTIKVEFSLVHGMRQLRVSDEGGALPLGFDPNKSATGLGMKVITTIAKQLHARVTAEVNSPGRGSCFTVAFPG